jgi:hypothetical protein
VNKRNIKYFSTLYKNDLENIISELAKKQLDKEKTIICFEDVLYIIKSILNQSDSNNMK